jgi:hypothetical protein
LKDSSAIGTITTNATGAAYTYAIQAAGTIENCLFAGSIQNHQQRYWINNALGFTGETIKNSTSIPSSLVGSNTALVSRKIIADVPTTAPICTNNISYAGALINGQKVTGVNLNDPDGLSKTITELQDEATYSELGWDFKVWKMGDSIFPFPILRWLDEITIPVGYTPIW